MEKSGISKNFYMKVNEIFIRYENLLYTKVFYYHLKFYFVINHF